MSTIPEILVVDIESTCWEESDPLYKLKQSQILEVGVAVLNTKTYLISKNESLYVQVPADEISPFCTELTGITSKIIEKEGIPFSEVLSIIKKRYNSKQLYWASYGNYDRRMFEQQCKRLGLEYPFHPTHFNVKSLYKLLCGLEKEVAMPVALENLKIPMQGKHHSGKDDAYNIAQILAQLI